jgi:peptidoglycan/LPS O-acetylase OafA/YrhL
VDVFFVLSGYLITRLLVDEIDRTGSIEFPRFYARRARRLLPALTLTLLITVIVGVVIYPPSDVLNGAFASTALSTAAYASNLHFARWGDNYFGSNPEKNPLLHTWSLCVEEQLYLIWPLFVLVALKGLTFQSAGAVHRRRLLWCMATAVILSFALSLYLTFRKQSWAYFSSPTRAWEFALGGIAVFLPARGGHRPFAQNVHALWGWVGIGGICWAAFAFGKHTLFPGTAVVLPAVSSVLVLRAGGIGASNSPVKILSLWPFQRVGQLSYSWYLWHWPVLVMGAALLPEPSLSVRVGLAGLSLGISEVSYRLIENPVRSARTLSASNKYSLAMAGLLAVAGISVSLVWRQTSIRRAQEPAQLRFTIAHNDYAESLLNDKCTADLADIDVRTCTFGAETSPATMLLFGDSHAAQWFPALESISAKSGYRLLTMVKLGCPAAEATVFESLLGRTYTECEKWRKSAIQMIRQIQPALTVVSSTDRYVIGDSEWRNGIDAIVKSLAESSKRVLILRDTPGADFDIPSCLARRQWRPFFVPSSSCEFSSTTKSAVYELQRSAASRYKNVLAADMSLSICPSGTCTGLREGLVMYRDSDHLTASFAKTLENDLLVQIDRVLEMSLNSEHVQPTRFTEPHPEAK